MPLALDSELLAIYEGNPALSQPPPPLPEGVSLGEHLRNFANRLALIPFKEHFAKHLPAESEYTLKDYSVPVKDGEVTVRSVIPTGGAEDATYPVLVWYHGGGWVVGDLTMDDNYMRVLSVDLKLAVVNVNYRLAPEHPSPTAHEDCYTALKWVVDNAAELKLSLEKGFLVGGDSAGGNLAAVMALQARDDPFFSAHPLTGQWLCEPMLLHPAATPEKWKDELRSYDENAEAPIINKAGLLVYLALYNAPLDDVRVSPVLAPSHAGLPPMFIQVMECDPLRDEGVLYERLLREAGAATRLVRYPGLIHGSHVWFPAISKSADIDRDRRDGLRWLLGLGKGAQ